MFSLTWKKYLPAIAILLKRAATGPQTLGMNATDFVRAAAGRKIKFSFHHLFLNNGRLNNEVKHSPVAKEFASILQEDENIKKLLTGHSYEFSLSNDFGLLIKDSTAADSTAVESAAPVASNALATA